MDGLDNILKIDKATPTIIDSTKIKANGYLVPLLIPPEGIIAFLLTHSKKVVAFMPIFSDLTLDSDVRNISNTQRILIPAEFKRGVPTK